MKIKALVPFSTGPISMEQYEVREVTDALGNELTSAGVAVEIGGGSGGGGVLAVTESSKTLSASFDEILAALRDGKTVQIRKDNGIDIVPSGIIYGVDEYAGEYGDFYYAALGFVNSGSANPNFYIWETQNPSTSSLTRS